VNPQALREILAPARPTEVVDIGANPIDGVPPYQAMLEAGLCRVTGFEPQEEAFAALQAKRGPHERYFPWAVGDGNTHELNLCAAPGMSSLYEPDPAVLEVFELFKGFGQVLRKVPVATRRLDDVEGIDAIDFLKIDVQGAELMVFEHGRARLARAVAVHTEVSFVGLYRGQPGFGAVDAELRAQGFIPHALASVKKWPIAPCVVNGDPRQALHQLLEADIAYVRDFTRPAAMDDEQFKHLALVAHHCYGSVDLALRCLMILEERGAVAAGARAAYVEALSRRA
jgi:FkbM family methyltransferase